MERKYQVAMIVDTLCIAVLLPPAEIPHSVFRDLGRLSSSSYDGVVVTLFLSLPDMLPAMEEVLQGALFSRKDPS